MKLLGALLGLLLATALHRFAPEALVHVVSTTGISGSIAIIAGLLTAPWAVVLQRLSVFEKLEDLDEQQVNRVLIRARSVRKFIIRSTVVNTLSVACAVALLAIAPKSIPAQFALPTFAFVWVVGLVQAWRCWSELEESRQTITVTQVRERQRKAYIKSLREDCAKHPVDRNDPHLNGYTKP